MHDEDIICHLKRDAVLAGLIERFGPPELDRQAQTGDLFALLVDAIISQQISARAAASIGERLRCVLLSRTGAGLTPENVAAAGLEGLRSCGISIQKARYLMELAQRVLSGDVALESLRELDDEEVIRHLVRLKGIGRWTAQMFLIFALFRPDVLPVDDYGFRTALQRQYGLPGLPGPSEIEQLAEPWRPFRTYAAWYLWRSLENTQPARG